MANTSAIWQQAAHTTYQLSPPSCSTRDIQKNIKINNNKITLNEIYLRGFWKISQENGPLAQRQKEQEDKRGNRKVQSDDSPEILDKGGHQTSPASLRRPRRGWGLR